MLRRFGPNPIERLPIALHRFSSHRVRNSRLRHQIPLIRRIDKNLRLNLQPLPARSCYLSIQLIRRCFLQSNRHNPLPLLAHTPQSLLSHHRKLVLLHPLLKHLLRMMRLKLPSLFLTIKLPNAFIKLPRQAADHLFIAKIRQPQSAAAHSAQMSSRLDENDRFALLGDDHRRRHAAGGASINANIHLLRRPGDSGNEQNDAPDKNRSHRCLSSFISRSMRAVSLASPVPPHGAPPPAYRSAPAPLPQPPSAGRRKRSGWAPFPADPRSAK